MSNQWSSGQFQQGLPSDAGQVKMFDPTQFQVQTPFGRAQPSKSVPESTTQNAGLPHPQQLPPAQTGHTSWDSWDSWNFDGSSHQPVDNKQQGANSGVTVFDERVTDSRFYGGMWNGTDQIPYQPQAYDQSNIPAFYNQPHQHPVHDVQQYDGVSFNESSSDLSSQHLQNQQNDAYFGGQFYNPLQNQLGGQGQNYNQTYEQIQGNNHAQPYYDQRHDDSIWATSNESGQWADNQHEFPFPDVAKNKPELNNSENIALENIPQATNDVSSDGVGILPSVEVFDNDDDGTVSGFFGRDGDGDGDVQLDTQRHIHHGGESGDNSSSGVNQFLSVTPMFHRTNSEISNASLSTLNLSVSEDDDCQEPLHNIQELVQRMEEINLAQQHGKDKNENKDNVGDRVSTYLHFGSAVQDSSADLEPKQRVGDYSGFGSEVYNTNNVHDILPLDKNIRSSSPIGDHPGSAESGESGGSSGLADWEFVSSQTRPVTHNRNSSLDNNVTTFTDKPDGGVSLSHDLENIDQEGKSTLNLLSSSTFNHHNLSASQSTIPSGNLSHPHTFLESTDSHLDTRGRSGSPFVAAFTDHRQEGSLPPLTQMPSKASATFSLNLNSNTTAAMSAEDGTANLSKRDVKSNSRVISRTSHLSSSSSLSSLPDNRQAKSSDPWISQGLAATPLKHKLSTNSLTDDGNCTSKRDAGKTIKSTETVSTQKKLLEEPASRSSSRNSEEVSSQQRRHHSAFHAVGRPRQTAMSPATTLWDNSETPVYNILLAPAMLPIIPTLNTNPVSADAPASPKAHEHPAAEKLGTVVDSSVVKSKSREQNSTTKLSVETKDSGKRDTHNRSKEGSRKEDKNRSYDSLDEVDAVPVEQRNQSYDSQRSDPRETSYNQEDSYMRDPDRPMSRSERPSSRSDRSGHYHYDRPVNRTEDPNRRHHSYYRDYGDGSYDERYDRPRSRQDESQVSRPSSRSIQEVDRPRSRTNYEHDRDYYYKDRHRGYGYDSYGRHVDYYDERERYYRYYKEKEARYTRGYYDEYYGTKQADYYYQRQQGQQPSSQESEQSSSRSQSRVSTPAMAPSPAVPPSPGIRTSGHDYYGNRSSRPDSRTDYNRDYYNRGYGYDGYSAFYDGYGYDPYAYGYTYPTYDDYSQGYNQGRMTPPKYSYPHTRACFGPAGQLLKVLPNLPANGQPAVVELQDVQTVLESCPEADELKRFPGPLTRTHTHKKDVLIYCQQKAKSCREDINMVDRESAQLIWQFLELLIKQNGSVVGTDLADLLLEGHEPSTHENSTHGVKISQSPELLDSVPEGNSEGSSNSTRASPAVRVTSDRTVINSADREREKWIDRFRNLLLYGHKKDALECAMKNNLWGHALFLASKMDARTHANVMTRFANGAIRMNDTLQTLYQLMSGRQPAAVTCVVDERWGDWRPHLAMILSNQTSRPDVDRKSITTLGDTLAARGYLHASHFCYLMAQINFGSYMRKTSKIVLIGSNHNLSVDEFATNDAVQCTEVYEYAQSLGSPGFCLPHFQIFKYLYACRLADYGMSLEALQYCEVIANNICQYPSWFHSTCVRLVYQLSSKLKFCDPQRQLTSEDADDPLWLQQLEKICVSYDDGSVQPLSGTATPAGYPGTTTSSESGDYSSYGYGYRGDATTPSTMSSAPVIGAYGHQQVNNADSDGHDAGLTTDEVQNMNIAGIDQQADYSQQQYDYTQWQQSYGYQFADHGDQHLQQQQLGGDQTANQVMQQQTSHHHSHPSAQDNPVGDVGHSYITGSIAHADNVSYHGGSQLDSSSTSTQLTSSFASTQPAAQSQSRDHGNFEAAQQGQHAVEGDDAEDVTDGAVSSFDYFGNVGAHKVVAPPHRYRRMSGSSVGSTSRRRTTSGSSTGSVKAAPHKPAQQQHSIGGKGFNKVTKNDPHDGGSGWFGGLFNKFKVKGKNEMILPDDKNPAIVWDPLKKKWTNADGTEEETVSAAPPPKDIDLMGKPSGIPSTTSGPPPPSMAPGGNRFSLKAKGARSQYVDVTNPKAVSVPHNLFNVMPGNEANTSSTAGINLFLPGSGPVSDPATTETINRNIDMGSLIVPNSTDKPITDNTDNTTLAPQTTPGMPMLFNPSNLKSDSTGRVQAPSSSAGPGLKFGQRRAYPK